MCVDPVDDGGVCCGLPGVAQFWMIGLVLSGDCRDVSWRDGGLGLFSRDSHDETRHFQRLTNILIVLIKYTRVATGVSEMPENVIKRTNHMWASCFNSCTCCSVDIVSNPLHPSMAVSRASCHTKW